MMEQLIMALGMTELCRGLTAVEYRSLLEQLPADKGYMPIEYHGNNISAYGFVEADYYEQHNFDPTSFEIDVVPNFGGCTKRKQIRQIPPRRRG